VRFIEIVREGKDADLGHIGRLILEVIALKRCQDKCDNGKPQPQPEPVPDNVNDENWWQYLQRVLNENPLLRFPPIA
jgi:hypothetical protein